MADRVIIVDIHRGNTKIPISELVQMKGRAARGHGETGYVDFVVSEDDVEELEEDLKDVENLRVDSVLQSNLAFHLVTEISRGKIRSLDTAKKWYSRSFESFTGIEADIYKEIDKLLEWECIIKRGKMYFPTELADISSKFYFHPSDVYSWYQNFLEIFECGIEDNDCAIAWALANVKKNKINFDVSKCYEAADEYKGNISQLDYTGTVPTGLSWWGLLGGPYIRATKTASLALKDDFGRINKALLGINKAKNMGQEKFFNDLITRIYYKIPQELVNLCRIEGVTKNLANELYNIHDVNCFEQLVEKIDIIKTYGSDLINQFLKEFINGR